VDDTALYPGAGSGRHAERNGRLVFVCHANHCRSPMMELLLRASLAATGPASPSLLVSSAGTYAYPDVPAHPSVVQVLAERGVDASGWRSTTLDLATVREADLVVTAAAEQRRDVVELAGPEAAAKTFTLLDLAAWLEAAPRADAGPTSGVDALLARAAAGRERSGPTAYERDLPDPMGRSVRQFRLCRRRVEAALEPFVETLAGVSPGATRGRRG
jgi:protein-tyrosine phosphatase